MAKYDFRFFKDLSKRDIGRTYAMQGRIEVVKQTSGPTLMVLNDGTQNFTFKAFIKPGERAYPEADIGDCVKLEAIINERMGSIEGEVKFLKKLVGDELKEYDEKIEKLKDEKVAIENPVFSIESKMLESQKDRFIKVAKIIRTAILEGRPILLRHNADCDGYSSALTIENAILSYMHKATGGDRQAPFQNYRRAPSKAPFYEYEDSVKDVSNWLRDKNRNGAKAPLIIITDNGSTNEDILSMKQMLIYGADIVVVDHHLPGPIGPNGECEVDDYIIGHINPYITGYDSNVCAGMLGYELANFIDEDNTNSVFIPAMAGFLDHCDCPELGQYAKRAELAGFDEKYLRELGEIVDMQSHYFRFMESREFFQDLFGKNMTMQKKLVEMLTPELDTRYKAVIATADKYAEVNDYGKFYFVTFDGERGTHRGEYPAVGKATNAIHKYFEDKLDKPIVTMTHGTTFGTVRVSDGVVGFNMVDYVNEVFDKLPHAYANGGGHEHAGSVRFVEYARKDIMALFQDYLKRVNEK